MWKIGRKLLSNCTASLVFRLYEGCSIKPYARCPNVEYFHWANVCLKVITGDCRVISDCRVITSKEIKKRSSPILYYSCKKPDAFTVYLILYYRTNCLSIFGCNFSTLIYSTFTTLKMLLELSSGRTTPQKMERTLKF